MKIIRFQYFYLKMELVLNKNRFSNLNPGDGARIFSVWMLGTSVWLWQGDWLSLFAWQKPKSWISHFLLSAFRLLHFSFSFFLCLCSQHQQHLKKPCTSLVRAVRAQRRECGGKGVKRWLCKGDFQTFAALPAASNGQREMAIGKGRTAVEF